MTSFLFASENPFRVVAMRIGLGLVLLFDAATRWPYLVELYSSDGMPMPMSPGTMLEPPAFSAGITVVLYSMMLFALAAVIVGWQTRLSLLIAVVLTTSIGLLDAAGTFKKYSVIAVHLLILLACSRCGSTASVDVRVNGDHGLLVKLTPVWPRRLMQFLLSSIYIGAAITKMRLPDFGSGDLLMFSLLDERWGGNWMGMWLATQPRLLILASYATVMLELLAAILLWIPRTRFPTIVVLLLFHLSIGLSMHVGIFSPVMMIALIVFTDRKDLDTVRRCAEFITRRKRRPPDDFVDTVVPLIPVTSHIRNRTLSLAAYMIIGMLCVGLGYAQQSTADYSGVFHPAETREWEYVSDNEIAEIKKQAKPNPADYFHRIEIGSRIGFRQAFGERKNFRRGMTVHVIARLQQNHPDLKIEWILQTPGNRESFRHTQVLQRQFTYASTGFRLTDPNAPSGAYTIVVIADGEVVAKRFFTLVEEE